MAGKKVMKTMIAVAIAITIAVVPWVQSTPPAQASTTLSQLQQKQADLKRKQQQVAATLDKLKADKTQKVAYKNALVSQMNNVEGQIDVLNEQIVTLNANIKAKEKEIAAKQVSINQNFNLLKERVRALYLMGEASNLEIVLNAKNVTDFADKVEMLRAVTSHDKQLIDSLKSELKSIQSQKAEIEQSRNQVAASKKELDAKQSQLNTIVAQTQAAIQEIDANTSAANNEKRKIAKEEEAADAAVDKWYQDYYASLNHNNGGGNGGSGSGGYISTGHFQWPVPGFRYISSYYGETEDRSKPHPGIDIAGHNIYGAPIVAADSGRVIWTTSGWGGGYGNSVCIDHGGGYSTRYAHMSSVAVSTGQYVTKGQIIGYVGSSGDSTGPHCHFEIRKNGYTTNPLSYFK